MKYYLEKDYFKIGHVIEQNKIERINLFLFLGISSVLLVILFHIILGLTTNYHKLSNLDDYVDDFTKGKYFSKFNRINLGVKIMPSYNLERNILYMNPFTDPDFSIIEGSGSIANSYDLDTTFFRTNQTEKVFPVFSFTKENVPLGNSISMCLAFHWSDIRKGRHYEDMKIVEGMPQCDTTLSGKYLWNEEDTENGIDIPVWIQYMNNADCSEEDCPNYCLKNYGGAFVFGVNKHVCYSYEILDSICIVIKYDRGKDQYIYHGGCFPGGKTYKMKSVTFGFVDKFTQVDIEVRDLSDPVTQGGEMTRYYYGFGTFWRGTGFILNILLILALVLIAYSIFAILSAKNKDTDNLPRGELYAGDINQGA